MLRWTHLAAAVALGRACNYPFLMNNSYGCARDPCAALDAVACAAEATCDMSSVGCATACAALNSSQCGGLAANYTLYYSTFNMDDITYGPLKCSQETVVSDDYMSYWYECSGNGTAGGGASGQKDDDGGVSSYPGLDDDAAVDPMTAAMSPSDPSTYALVLSFVLGLVVAAATWYKVLSRCCKGQEKAPWTAAETSNRLREPLARAASVRVARHHPALRGFGALKRLAAVLIVLAGKLVGYVAGLLAGAGVLGTMGVAGLPKFSMEAPGTAKILAALAALKLVLKRYASMLAPKAAFSVHLLDEEGKPVTIGEDKEGNPVTLAPVWSVEAKASAAWRLPGLREKRPVALDFGAGEMRPGLEPGAPELQFRLGDRLECWCCCFPYFTRTPAELKLGDATAAVGQPARCCLAPPRWFSVYCLYPCSFFRPDKCSLGGLLSGERTSIKLANNDKALLKKKVRDTINAAKAAVVAIFAPVRILVDKWKAKAAAAKVAVEGAARAAAGAKKDEAPAPAPASKVPTFSLNFGADGACALPTPVAVIPGIDLGKELMDAIGGFKEVQQLQKVHADATEGAGKLEAGLGAAAAAADDKLELAAATAQKEAQELAARAQKAAADANGAGDAAGDAEEGGGSALREKAEALRAQALAAKEKAEKLKGEADGWKATYGQAKDELYKQRIYEEVFRVEASFDAGLDAETRLEALAAAILAHFKCVDETTLQLMGGISALSRP